MKCNKVQKIKYFQGIKCYFHREKYPHDFDTSVSLTFCISEKLKHKDLQFTKEFKKNHKYKFSKFGRFKIPLNSGSGGYKFITS